MLIGNVALGKPTYQSSNFSRHTSELAVDGTLGHSYSDTPCTHTRQTPSPASWRVTLGAVYWINNFTIYNRKENLGRRLSGFILSVGNSSQAYKTCYKDTTPITTTPGPIVTGHCTGGPVSGDTVMITSRPDEYLTLCEVLIFVCSAGWYGEMCGRQCNTTTACSKCDVTRTRCTECVDGRWEKHCQKDCGHCWADKCDKDTGECPLTDGKPRCDAGFMLENCSTACGAGTYGHDCKETCGSCASGPSSCNTTSGHCRGNPRCMPGYSGLKCKTDCEAGKYGHDCNETCGSCASGSESCNTTSGHCQGESRCMPGYSGLKCNTACEAGTYGHDCNKTCGSCASGPSSCNTTSGHCRGNPRCMPGYSGLKCKTGCDAGFWGAGCEEKCGECYNNVTCDRASGGCPITDENPRCKAGFLGSNCRQTCSPGTWGQNCKLTCSQNCLNGPTGCDVSSGACIGGCTDGHEGRFCTPVNYNYTGVVIGCVAVVVAVVIVVIVLMYTRRCHGNKSGGTSERSDPVHVQNRESSNQGREARISTPVDSNPYESVYENEYDKIRFSCNDPEASYTVVT
ncbi:multiple epidermal growth factor-like domains protein 11 [Liolophura sinensis]|uniref:multiple epidermal growth factor-like domains protein 11 n=1 Tax=Liolophura sinensis TaxID=3198878 RepID=UPI0031594BC0